MSIKSQERNMRRIADLLDKELSYNEDNKKEFLNKSRAFLRNIGKDLGLSDVKVGITQGGISVSGDCTLIGVWADTGIYICISNFSFGEAILYREARHMKDYAYGTNRYIRQQDLRDLSYQQLLSILLALKS